MVQILVSIVMARTSVAADVILYWMTLKRSTTGSLCVKSIFAHECVRVVCARAWRV